MSRLGILGLAALLALPASAASGRASTPTSAPIVFAADRAPSLTGEVYRLDSNGHRVDLSKSPFQDVAPVVSPNGKRVAFISDRKDGKARVYEVGIGGKRLVQVGPVLASSLGLICGETLAWQPGGSRLAATACGRGASSKVLILQRGHRSVAVHRGGFLMYSAQWSPDGRVLLAMSGHTVVAASPQGKILWTVKGARSWAVWSAHGLVAIPFKGSVGVYDEHGTRRFSAPAAGAFTVPAWSRGGDELAVDTGKVIVVLSSTGERLLQKPLQGAHGLVWTGNGKVVVGGFGSCGCKAKSLDVRTGRFAPASDRWFDTLSADGTLAIVTSPRNKGVSYLLGAASPAGGRAKTYAHVPGCWQYHARTAAIGWQQFVGTSIVYESWGYCDEPYSNLYSVSPGGGKPHRLTNAQAQQTQPAPSPDGTKVAYVWAKLTGISCSGCSDGIRVANADGSGERTLTNPENCTFDDSPTWSPDWTTILYSETGCDSSGELFTVPAAGGTPHDLGILGQDPAWGPTRIAYVGSDQSDHGLWTANPDGSDPVEVAAQGGTPAWSADGRLAYLTNGPKLVVGSSQVALPFKRVTSLAWSPDGTRLVLSASKASWLPLDVWTIKPDGTGVVRLTKNYDVFGAG